MRRRKNLYTKETPPNSKTGGKVQQHLIKFKFSLNIFGEQKSRDDVVGDGYPQLPTPPKKRGNFLWEPP